MMRRMLLSALLLTAAAPVSAQTPLPPLLDEAREIALARNAAPPELSAQADVYVLRRGGHVKVVEGTNGAACMVSRDHPESLYPICYDAEATRTVLPIALLRTRLREAGTAEAEIDAAVARAIESGEITLPRHTAIAFMMSRHQVIYAGAAGRRVGAWYPHIMMYMPYMTKEQLVFPGFPNGDLTLADEGQPTAHLVVMSRDWQPALPTPVPPLALEPGWVCPGDTTHIRWNTGSGTVRVQAGAASREVTLPASVRVDEETVITHAGGSDTISVHPAQWEHNVQRRASCSGRLSVVSTPGLPEGRASERIRPRSVVNNGTTAVVVTHRGRSVRLAPGEATSAFSDVPFTGDWGVVVDTGVTNEFCPVPEPAPPGGAPAPEVHVVIVTSCDGR